MKIDYERNPLAVIKRFTIPYTVPYAEGMFLIEGRIRGIIEEGYDEVNWFVGEVCYPKLPQIGRNRDIEIGGQWNNKLYQELKMGSPVFEEVEQILRNWCRDYGLEISTEIEETVGVTR